MSVNCAHVINMVAVFVYVNSVKTVKTRWQMSCEQVIGDILYFCNHWPEERCKTRES